MTFWRDDVIEFSLDQETVRHVSEQRAWILREPANPRPFYNLARLYRMQGKAEEALALLLEAVRLDPVFAEAHAALAEVYAVRNEAARAWWHAREAEAAGDGSAVRLLRRHAVPENPPNR